MSENDEPRPREVLIVGGGVAGLTAATYTARAGLDTLVCDVGESILRRNAHLENVPGFPAGVNSSTFLDLLDAQAARNGVDSREARVVALERVDAPDDSADGDAPRGFEATLDSGDAVRADRVIAASWSDADYLDGLDVDLRDAGSKQYVQVHGDDGGSVEASGRTTVDGLYAAGRLADQYHQAVVAAGHGAQVAITLIHDADVPYYHDWVAPEGYFTDRDREVPPGCEEIDESERRARERESMAAMREYFADPHPERQRTHPSLTDDPEGRLPEDDD